MHSTCSRRPLACGVAQNRDESHREVIGPQLGGSSASGVVMYDGSIVAEWGDPQVPEMAFSVTKSVLSMMAGIAFDDGLLALDEPVRRRVGRDEFTGSAARDFVASHWGDDIGRLLAEVSAAVPA